MTAMDGGNAKGPWERPLPFEQCLLYILEPPCNGPRRSDASIDACAGLDPVSGATGFFYFGHKCANGRFKKLSFGSAR